MKFKYILKGIAKKILTRSMAIVLSRPKLKRFIKTMLNKMPGGDRVKSLVWRLMKAKNIDDGYMSIHTGMATDRVKFVAEQIITRMRAGK